MVALQMVVWWMCTYQIDMQSWLRATIFIKLQVLVPWDYISYGHVVYIC